MKKVFTAIFLFSAACGVDVRKPVGGAEVFVGDRLCQPMDVMNFDPRGIDIDCYSCREVIDSQDGVAIWSESWVDCTPAQD